MRLAQYQTAILGALYACMLMRAVHMCIILYSVCVEVHFRFVKLIAI